MKMLRILAQESTRSMLTTYPLEISPGLRFLRKDLPLEDLPSFNMPRELANEMNDEGQIVWPRNGQ